MSESANPYWNQDDIQRFLDGVASTPGFPVNFAQQAPRAYKPGESPSEPYKAGDLVVITGIACLIPPDWSRHTRALVGPSTSVG